MAHADAGWPLAGHPPNPSLAASRLPPPPPPSTPAARRPDATRMDTQDTSCVICVGDESESADSTKSKQDSKHTQDEIHHTFKAMWRAKGVIRPDSPQLLKMPRSSSKLVMPLYQSKDGKFYNWRLIGKHMKKKQRQPNNHIKNVKISNPSQPNEDSHCTYGGVKIDLDLTEGEEPDNAKSDIGMKLDARGEDADMCKSEDFSSAMDDTATLITDSDPSSSCAAPSASLCNRCFHLDSANCPCQSSEVSLAGSDLMSDNPPGFRLDMPPCFKKAHGQPHSEPTALSYATPPGVPFDISPGFTETNCYLPTIATARAETGVSNPETENKPLIRLPQNIPRPVKTIFLPGFAAVKVTDKGAPSSLVTGPSSISETGDADEMKITDEVRVKHAGHLRCTDVYRPMPANLTGKFQEIVNHALQSPISVLGKRSTEHKNMPSTHSLESAPPAKHAAMWNGGNSVPSYNFDVSSGHKSVPIEDLEKQGHQKKRKLQELPHSLPDTIERAKVNVSGPNQDFEQLSQVFVHFCSTCLSMQVNKKTTTIRELVNRAMWRLGIMCFDAYVLYCGKVLDETYVLSPRRIPRDASFVIIPRLRAGHGQYLNAAISFHDFTKEMKPFYKVNIPHALRKETDTGDLVMIFLSQAARYLVHRMFTCLVRLHEENLCLEGKFQAEDFLFVCDTAIFNDRVNRVGASPAKCILDFRRLSKIIVKLFRREGLFPTQDNLPGYVGHLVKLLRVFASTDEDKSMLRSCISNHCALVSFRERIRKILEMERSYYYLDGKARSSFKFAAGDFGEWHRTILDIRPIHDTYMHNDVQKRSRFGSDAVSWMEFVRNFYSHPDETQRGGTKRSLVEPLKFNEEQAEAAVSLYFPGKLAEFLLNVARKFKFPIGVDKKLLFGNEMADPDARGGQSGGTEFQQSDVPIASAN